jgi:hypothetical protein
MAVVAGAIKDGGDFGRELSLRSDCASFVNRRVGARRADELQPSQNNRQDDGRPLQYFRYGHAH